MMKQNLMIASTIALIAVGGFAVAQTADTDVDNSAPVAEAQVDDTDNAERGEREGRRHAERDGHGKRGGDCDGGRDQASRGDKIRGNMQDASPTDSDA